MTETTEQPVNEGVANEVSEKTKTKTKTKKRLKKRPLAECYDKYELYQQAVQEPEADVEFLTRIYRERYGTRPRRLREDFCGTSLLSCEWVKAHPENEAYGYDIDLEPIEWGMKNNASKLSEGELARLHIHEGNALDVCDPKADVLVGFNFSYFLFKTRDALKQYIRAAYENVAEGGLFALDIMGGPDAMIEGPEERDCPNFVYVWDQVKHDPITNGVYTTISFEFEDGSVIEKAFEYDWRIWTIPEVRELMEEVGFRETACYWEGTDPETEEGDGNFSRADTAETCDCWIAYIVGYK